MKKTICVLLLMGPLVAGCGMSDGQEYKLASTTYQATVRSITVASKADLISLADMERVAVIEGEAFDLLGSMRSALLEARSLDFEFYRIRASALIDRLIIIELEAQRTKERQP